MTEEEFVTKTNVDKAKTKTNIAIFWIILNLLSYYSVFIPSITGEKQLEDFGIFFEGLALLFTIIARYYMTKYYKLKAKICIVIALISAGWLFIYDIISLLYNLQIPNYPLLDHIFADFLLAIYIILFINILKDLSKADNPVKYKESTDWFYEKYDEEIKNKQSIDK